MHDAGIKAKFFACGENLGAHRKDHGAQQIVERLHGVPGARVPGPDHVGAHALEQRPRILEIINGTANHDRQRSRSRARRTARDGRVQVDHAFGLRLLRVFDGVGGSRRTHVDDHRSRGQDAEQAFALGAATHHFVDDRTVREHQHDNVRTGEFSQSRHDLAASRRSGLLRARRVDVEHEQFGVTLEVADHAATHDAKADEADGVVFSVS